MADQLQVRKLIEAYPELTAAQIAERIGSLPAYVRATAKRLGLPLPAPASPATKRGTAP